MARELVKLINHDNEERLGYAWTTGKLPKANVVIVTGMEEYALRYDDFATFLNKNGYDVYCFDHYGQGESAKTLAEQGIVPHRFFTKSVENIDEVVTLCKLSCVPTYIFSHSMGSFMTQDYIQRYADHVDKVVICGSNGPNAKMSYKFGRFLSHLLTNKRNRDKKAKLMNNIVFGMYSKQVKNAKTSFDWLSVNEENVEKYIKDPRCGYMSTNGFYVEFMKGCNRLYRKKFLNKINKKLPIFIIAGEKDPVGANGKGPNKLKELYQKFGLENVKLKLYKGLRHEILNEKEHDVVYDDILKFFEE